MAGQLPLPFTVRCALKWTQFNRSGCITESGRPLLDLKQAKSRRQWAEDSSEKLEIPCDFRRLMKYLTSRTPNAPRGFRVNPSIRRKPANSKRRIQRRLDKPDRSRPGQGLGTSFTLPSA